MVKIIKYQSKYKQGALDIYTKVLGIIKGDAEKDLAHHAKNEVSKVFICAEGDKVIGLTTFYWQKWNMTGRIGIIGVIPGAQGKGIGKKMCGKVFKFAKSINLRKVYVDTSAKNKPARGFYKKAGFRQEYIMKDYYKDGEDGVMCSRKI